MADSAAVVAADPRLEHIAAEIRCADPADGRLDIPQTAAALDLQVRDADLGDKLLAALFGDVVVLNSGADVTPGRRRFAFAHEVAHALIRRGVMPWVDGSDEEWWADWFAHELVFPRSWLREPSRWRRLRLFDDPEEHRTIALQLAALSGEQTVFRFNDDILCARCGEQPFFRNCDCRRFHDGRAAREELPLFEPALVQLDQLQLFEPASFRDLLSVALARHAVHAVAR